MTDELDFLLLNDTFLNMGAVNSPAEVQGFLCGLLCGKSEEMTEVLWFEKVLHFMDLEHMVLEPEQHDALALLYSGTMRLVEDVNFSFTPLLPDDDASIERRVQELGFLCQGFLHGVGVSDVGAETEFSADAAAALRDIAQISQADAGEDGDDSDWVELVEYVKVAILMLLAELKGDNVDKGSDSVNTVH